LNRNLRMVLILIGIALSACSEVEEKPSDGYEPATLVPVDGADLERVTFTAEGAQRTGLKTAMVRQGRVHNVVPYDALIYDGAGRTYVYTSPKPLTFLRAEVKVDRVEGDRVLLTDGPPPGSDVVTTGAAQVYGTELEISGGH
jgi:multidrug efflux pump subunit AcrA (membrane-fusion protein)